MEQMEEIKIQRPKIHPKFTNIGFGNPRYNSMLVHEGNVLIPCGCTLRLVDLRNDCILFSKQIGHSQIFQIMRNTKYVLVVNFDGYLSLLDQQLEVKHQFYAPGKEIRHISLTDTEIIVSCELNQGTKMSLLAVFPFSEIEQGHYESLKTIQGFYYYPEQINEDLVVIEYDDPNPKGLPRAETVMLEKLPVKHKIVKFDKEYQLQLETEIKEKGEILCACRVNSVVYYLHSSRKVTIFDSSTSQVVTIEVTATSSPLCLEAYKQGIIFSSGTNKLTYLHYDFTNQKVIDEILDIKSLGVGGNLSIKPFEGGYYLFNENGMHLYDELTKQSWSQSLFSITNCGLSISPDGKYVAVADFGGSVYVLEANDKSVTPMPHFSVLIGIPIRTIVWCERHDQIMIGCVGGGLYSWKIYENEANIIHQFETTVNILRHCNSHYFVGTADGFVSIYDDELHHLKHHFQAHKPIHYENQRDRQLFGSMKNYAEIWSLAISPSGKQHHIIVSSSEDQSEKVTLVKGAQSQELHHLKGHSLAVTSVDWKIMGKDLGEIYVSCSDDKVIRFRNPKKNFEIMFQIKTSTIKEWHTLTYLALEPNGHRVAVGSQNGYLFIYDILNRDLLYGEKIHLGGIEGLDWKNGKICTCSSDLCVSVIQID